MHGDLPFLQKIQCLARNLKAFSHSTREHDHCGAVVQQLLHVGRLNARSVTGSCLPPVSIARATGEKPCIFVRLTFSLDLEPAPGNVFDPWRTLLVFHHRNIVPGRRYSRLPYCYAQCSGRAHNQCFSGERCRTAAYKCLSTRPANTTAW